MGFHRTLFPPNSGTHFFSVSLFQIWVISPAANPGPKKTGSSEQVTLRHVLHLIDIEQGSGPRVFGTIAASHLVRSLNRSTFSRRHLETR
jgi:hypothetical protein